MTSEVGTYDISVPSEWDKGVGPGLGWDKRKEIGLGWDKGPGLGSGLGPVPGLGLGWECTCLGVDFCADDAGGGAV